MRLIAELVLAGLFGVAAPAPTPSPEAAASDPEDILGDLVVAARGREVKPLRLPKLGVEALAEDEDTAKLLAVIRRDLELSFELDVLAPLAKPGPVVPVEGAEPIVPVEPVKPVGPLERWREAGAEYVVQVGAVLQADGQVELSVVLYSLRDGDGPVFKRKLVATAEQRRLGSHRLSDALLGAITGYAGPFTSQLTFVRSGGGKREVAVIDGDGEGLAVRSLEGQLAAGPAFGPDNALYYAASVKSGRYRLYRDGVAEPIALPVVGSIYGLAFTDDRTQVALAIADEGDIKVFVGPADFSTLTPRTSLPLALHPVFSPRGALAFAGTARSLQRIYIDNRAVSAGGLSSSAPTFCRHPDGTRLVHGVTVGVREDVIASDERGGQVVRLTAGKGRNTYPACSPDGRLVAFFSTRSDGEGPGLYLMRVDGLRPAKKIADVLGDSLRWARIP